jgi:putative flavoprotein involved in K+ transport
MQKFRRKTSMTEHVDTIVIGGGQAGLSVSWHLQQAGCGHLVLDRGQTGDTWRGRWDSFCLVTPNRFCRLPGYHYQGDDPDGFMQRDEIVAYVENFAASFGAPLRNGVEVLRVSSAGMSGGFIVETSAGTFTAQRVIIATGTHQHPQYPGWHDKLSNRIFQLHSRDYRNPEQLPGGSVLVVGSGQSGCQLVEDLRGVGREVYLCVGKAARVPRRYRGRDIIQWAFDAGFQDLLVDDHPLGPAVRFLAHEHLTGRDGGHTIDLRQMGQDGVNLLGRLVDVDGVVAHFTDDLPVNLDAIDREYQETLDLIDHYIVENNIDAPADDSELLDWQPPARASTIDLAKAGITSIIYAIGFRYDFGWIDLPIFDERGYPQYRRGVTDIPGFYFVGLHWMHTAGSGLFSQVGRDAEYVVRHLTQNQPAQN